MDDRSQRVTREDLLLFVNACFACTGQKEYYGDGHGQRVSIGFLHEYILGNYRTLYARSLACGINHQNQALVVRNLLATGRLVREENRVEENALVTRALHALPTHRAMHLLESLAATGVNNRRTRALTKAYLAQPGPMAFRAVKYRRAFRRAAVHTHIGLPGELGSFFTRGWKERRFSTPLFESFRQAHYAQKAIYELPYSIAEGLAAKRGIARDVFLKGIDAKLTQNERLRLHSRLEEAYGSPVALEGAHRSPTQVASFVLSLPVDARRAREAELRSALRGSAERSARRTGARFGKVACVVDRSASSFGSSEKKRRPLAVALALVAYLRASSDAVTVHYSSPIDDELWLTPRGSTDLSTPILGALRDEPDLLVVVSDGFENDPPGVAGGLLEAAQRLFPRAFFLHVNPVYDVESYAPKSLSPRVPTMGIRDACDLPTLVAFAKLALGKSTLEELEAHLDQRVRAFLAGG